MGTLICTGITSLDGYVADADGNFDWSTPSDEVHTFVNDLERSVGTYLYGRRLYEVMVAWERMHLDDDDQPAVMRDYTAIWQAANKIVYSSTLAEPSSSRTRIERTFGPDAVRRLKESTPGSLSIGGPHLAAQAFEAGLIDEVQLFVSPIIIGGGTKFLPDDLHLSLELKDEYAFRNGVVYLGYRVLR
ncbi:dihydrofolate reductase family protein [Cryobacterium sp. SO2]|uniref:dihydrofolate reductase family protein n=1 Tax=Cryobacterium sp. SO2 TaxID=1897060 RepID=UPI00223C9692|nr:dihydrofolate reductase family protein [Cryobacterium sp. SO2]WEO77243.1 dihydrofolate reductase family protein [Cryobacterium sp. SO2]